MPAPLRYVQDSTWFPSSADVVVIGAGIAGVTAAYELARKGVSVVLIEKGLVAAEQSSRNWGWCRQQNRDERELPLIMYALQRWAELGQETGEELGFRRSGLVYATRSQDEINQWEAWNRMAQGYGFHSEILTAARAKALTPGSTGDWLGGISSPTDGQAEPSLAVPGLAMAAQRLGVMLFQQCAVRGLDISAGEVSGVFTERGMIKTRRVICAAGAWSSLFCRRHGIDLPLGNVVGTAFRTRPIEQHIARPLYTPGFACRPQLNGGYTIALAGRGRLEPGVQSLRYARQFYPTWKLRRKNLTVKIGPDALLRGPEALAYWQMDGVSPFEKMRILDPRPDMAIVEEALATMRREFPAMQGIRLEQAWGGMMDSTPDAVPVISPVDTLPGLIISAGYSGHGFGIGPGAGRLAADLAVNDTPIVDPTPFRYQRMIDGSGFQTPGMM